MPRPLPLPAAALLLALLSAAPAAAAPYTTYVWHMHQPLYWPDRSAGEGDRTERAYETITLGHSQNDVFSIFDSDDRVAAYQQAPRDAVNFLRDLPWAGAQLSFAGALVDNLNSLGAAGWNGGRYSASWWQWTREAAGWTDAGGLPRLDTILVGSHHAIAPLMDDAAFRMSLKVQKAARAAAWGASAPPTHGFFPAEMSFSQRLIPALVDEGLQWTLVPDIHIARACADYPANASLDNCDPPNAADALNPAQGFYYAQTISRGVTTRVPPMAFRPHHAEHVDPATGVVSRIVVVPIADAMSWNEGYGPYGDGEIAALLPYEDPAHPFLFVFCHDGDNAWAGGHSYYYESVSNTAHDFHDNGWKPATVQRYLADHPPAANDVVHVEDGAWVNADGDFGSPQFINWNWPLVDAAGQFDIPNGWAEDERNWAVLTAAQNRVQTAEAIAGPADPARVWNPLAVGATAVEKAWHFLMAAYESGYMYYGASLDMEIKATLACNEAAAFAGPVIAGGTDTVPPTVWLPQRLPWNPGGRGGGALWGYPGGAGAVMPSDFHVWTFAYDVSGVASCVLKVRQDADGANDPATTDNETYAGGPGVGAWQDVAMTFRDFPSGEPWPIPDVDFTVLPDHIADQWWAKLEGFENVLLDYYVEAVDGPGNVRRSPIQHVWVGEASSGGGERVTWTPEVPAAGGSLAITYDLDAGALPPGTNPVRIHVGHSGWQGILNPDPAMTANGDGTWTYTYAIPATATSVDFVFTDGAGAWDNNGGADWHVPVTGGAPGFVMDGMLDAAAAMAASAGPASVYAAWNGTHLYVATESVAQSVAQDHFVFVATSLGGTSAAPWAKAGTVNGSGWYVGNEDSNAWSGWSGWGGGAAPGSSGQSASGSVLEGALDLAALTGAVPAEVYLAVARYGTADGAPLAAQAPAGDGDGAIEAAEWVTFPLSSAVDVPLLPVASGGMELRAWPNPTRGPVQLTLDRARGGALRMDVHDVAGRRVATLLDAADAAEHVTLSWDGRDAAGSALGAGVFWVRAVSADGGTTARVVRLDAGRRP